MFKTIQHTFKAFLREFFRPELKLLFLIVLFTLGVGTFAYNIIEGWSHLDSLFFSVSTLLTIGFGDLVPETDAGKIFTIIYALMGVGILLGFLTMVARSAFSFSHNMLEEEAELEEIEEDTKDLKEDIEDIEKKMKKFKINT